MTFNDLKLSAPLLKAVSEAGYETPSPIQASAIPPVLEGRDLMGCAQTGTGKTAAFALPMLDRQGRIQLPAKLREYAGLDHDVTIIGSRSFAEIWNTEAWNASQETSDEDFTAEMENLDF